MKELSEAIRPVLAASLAAILATCNEGCYQPQLTREQQYVLDIHACSARAHTKAQAVACRRAVNEQYGLCDEWPRVSPCEE